MRELDRILDKIKESRSLASDNALAKVLGVGRGTVSSWRHDVRLPDTATCGKLAELSGEPLQRVLGLVNEARELSSEAKAVWRQFASAAAVVLAVFAVALGAGPAQAENTTEMRPESSLCAIRKAARLGYLARLRHFALSIMESLHAWTIGRPVPQMA